MTTSEAVEPFQIRRLPFEYEDCPGTYKERPVVVAAVDNACALVVLAKVTGHGPRPEYPGEVRLRDWREAGLSKQSTVRCSKTIEVDLMDVEDALLVGELSEFDMQAVRVGLYEAGKTAAP